MQTVQNKELDWEALVYNFNQRITAMLSNDGKNMRLIKGYISDCETSKEAPEKIRALMVHISSTTEMLIAITAKTPDKKEVLQNIATIEKEIFGATLLGYAIETYATVSRKKEPFRLMNSYEAYMNEIIAYSGKINSFC